MAFAITNKAPFPYEIIGVPSAHKEVADQSADIAAQDLGIVGLKWLRVRVRVKTLTGTTPTVQFRIAVDSVSGMTAPEVVAYSPVIGEVVLAETYNLEMLCWSEKGFQFVNVDITLTGTTPVIGYDVMFDAA